MEISRVGVDLAKNVFQVHAVDGRGKPIWRCSLKRERWLAEITELGGTAPGPMVNVMDIKFR